MSVIGVKREYHGKKQGINPLSRQAAPYVFSAPFVLFHFTFLLFPILFNFYMSLTNWTPFDPPAFAGIRNYLALFVHARFYRALCNTFILMLMIIPLQLTIGMIIAVILSYKSMIMKDTYRLCIFLPYLTTPVALGLFFAILFDPTFGYINMALDLLHLPQPDWTGRPWAARAMVALITIWRWSGYTGVMFMAGITNISDDIFEACEIDGANGWQRFWYVILPMVKPVAVFVTLTTLIGCFQIFEEPLLLFSGGGSGRGLVGGPRGAALTGVWLMYDTAFGDIMNYGFGASISYGLFLAIALVTLVFNRIVKIGDSNNG
ncbi:MAG: sugar ABC transporter permease [Treponema sp.]|jgi:multiple sugar transport system permease protein/cellobiose transport system permease protein|nr:sugar ABC transporter permease [Treponema sp.]